MNAERLLAHYKQIADAPDAIARLRRFILDLAVRGKLVPQDPSDEPASELLKRIAAEKARLVKAGEAKRQDTLPKVDLYQVPFDLPIGWAWGRFPEVGTFGRGKSKHRPRNDPALFDGGQHVMIQTGDVARSKGVIETYTSKYNDFGLSQSFKWPKGTLCITIAANIADSGILSFDACFPDSVVGFLPAPMFDNARYFEYFVRTAKANLLEFAPATAQKNINLEILKQVLIPLPPLAEQHRIVAKVDELFALCDRLEAARAEREASRDRLAAASLARLNAPNPKSFDEDGCFALNALPTLTTRPDQIKALRQTILNLAVCGKLVPQDPNDEPAEELLKRISQTKRQLVASKMLRKIKELEPLSEQVIKFTIPDRWAGTCLGAVYDVRDGTHDTPKYVDDGYPLITSKNLSSGQLSFTDIKFISEKDHRQISERSAVQRDDILLAMIGSIGNPVVVDTDRPFSIKNVALLKYYDRGLSSPGYLRLFLQHAANEMRGLAAGGLQPFVSLGFLRNYPFALPPLAEQHRIVAKVDELMALCDQLEASLANATSTRSRLLNALLAEALMPAQTRELETVE